MRLFDKSTAAIAGAVVAIALAGAAVAEPIAIKPLYSSATEDMGGKHMTVLEATLEPRAGMPPHRHPGTVYVYVSSGSIRSKLDTDAEAIVYTAGQGWVEPPGIIHEIFENASDTDAAVAVATFIHKEGEDLILPVE